MRSRLIVIVCTWLAAPTNCPIGPLMPIASAWKATRPPSESDPSITASAPIIMIATEVSIVIKNGTALTTATSTSNLPVEATSRVC